jgi:ubiquinone/menaquinone biosynthesis C-methylase UbiE
MDEHIDTIIQDLISNYPEEEVNEVEFAVSKHKNSDESPFNIGINHFRCIMKKMATVFKIEIPEPELMLTVSTLGNTELRNKRMRLMNIDEIQTFCRNNLLPPDSDNAVFEDKVRLNKFDTNMDLVIRYSNEKEITQQSLKTDILSSFMDDKINKFYRFAKRYTLQYPVKLSKGEIKIDFTVLKEGYGSTFKDAKIIGLEGINTAEKYEIEVELVNLQKSDIEKEDVMNHIRFVIKNLLLILNGGITINNNDQYLRKINDYIDMCSRIYSLDKLSISDLSQESLNKVAHYNISVNIRTMDRSILISKEMHKVPYLYTDKADGNRALLHINNEGEVSLILKDTIKKFKYSKESVTVSKRLIFDDKPKPVLKLVPTDLILSEIQSSKVVTDETTGKKVRKQEYISVVNSLLDGELLHINNSYYFKTFDILIHNGNSIMETDFMSRLNLFKLISITEGNFSISPKKFGKYEGELVDFKEYINCSLLLEKNGREITDIRIKDNGITYELDGLIFQPASGELSYYPKPNMSNHIWHSVFKWKPLHHLTIDLKLDYKRSLNTPPVITKTHKKINGMELVETQKKYAKYDAYSGNRMGDCYLSDHPCLVELDINNVPRALSGDPIIRGNIVECRLSMTDGIYWIPVRLRYDKSKPNSLQVYKSTLHSITNEPITLDNLSTLDGGFGGHINLVVTKINRTISNRHITNWGIKIKNDVVLLDLGSGNAKSASSWRDIATKDSTSHIKVLGIDLADVQKAFGVMNSSFNKSRKNGEYYVKDFDFVESDFLTPLHLDKNLIHLSKPEIFNIVTCTFALHYAMRSEKDLRMFLANITRNLKLNGVFVGSYMNKRKVLDLFTNGNIPVNIEDNSVSSLTDDRSKNIIWKIKKIFQNSAERAERAESVDDLFTNHTIAIDFMGLYKNNIEYLVDLEDSRLKNIFLEYGLELVEHISFNEIIPEIVSDNKFIKEKYDNITWGEKIWMDLHYNFTFKKVSKPSSYQELFA